MTDPVDVETFEVTGIPESDKPPFVEPPAPQHLFAARATRFSALAPDHQLAPYLEFLAGIARAQATLAAEIGDPSVPPSADMRRSAANGMPVVPREDLIDEPLVYDAIARLLPQLDTLAMPDAARAALARTQAADEAALRVMVAAVLSDAVPVESVADHLFVTAALQVVAAKRSARVALDIPEAVADGVCPCCGGPPVSSVVNGGERHEGARYVHCALCSAGWNHVRVKCVSCGSTKGIAYQVIEGVSESIKAETCDACRSYVKILYRKTDPALDPVADDVASLGLDLLVREAGWRRAGVNPFLLGY